jgi:hypothetical protein
MAFAPLILKGNLELGGTSVASQVVSFMIRGTADTITIPATFGARRSAAKGDDTYELEIEFLQDTDTAAISQILWTELADADGELTFSGTFRSGLVSATNPEWAGTAIVVDMGDLGGTVNTVGTATVRLPLKDRPVRATS